ncbi:MAG: glutamate 5-kinase [Muribaculaceae bacterium]|nr:glutamate 5-kinase [Muribaculaceae bacterium]
MARIVVKIGSNVLTRRDGKPNVTNMSAIVDQVAHLRRSGHELILVSSGAVACGRGAVTPTRQLDSVAARQLFSSVGQIRLINIYNDLFAQYGIVVGQVLTQKENFSSRTSYLNQRSCMLTMIENGVVPIVNENDTASLTELMFTDNDELSGMIATMTDADMLVILSNVDGIYTGNPSDPDSRLIERVKPGEDVSGNVVASKSGFGRGGMGTKCGIATKVSEEGVTVIIARGDRRNVLVDLIEHPESVPHTTFEASGESLSTVKRWIAHSSSFAKGKVIVDENAEKVLRGDSAVSLLPIGVISIEGEWEEGDIITICGNTGTLIGVGRASLGSESTRSAIGQRGGRPVVHYDYLYIE